MFIAGTADWSVRSLENGNFPVYVVWNGPRLLGVAGSRDGLAELFIDVVRDFEKGKIKATTFPMYGIRRLKNGKVQTQEFVATITEDDAKDADMSPDVGKGLTKTCHHVVVRKSTTKGTRRTFLPWTQRNETV
jgi:hypothetical protein